MADTARSKQKARPKQKAQPETLNCIDLHGYNEADTIAEAMRRSATAATCIEHAFILGYQAAIRLQFPSLAGGIYAVCSSERGGASPKQLMTTAVQKDGHWHISGHKSFVTSPEVVQQSIVTAVVETDKEIARTEKLKTPNADQLEADQLEVEQLEIGLFIVATDAPQVRLEQYHSVSVLPKLGQGALFLEGVQLSLSARLQGDYGTSIRQFGVRESITCCLCAVSYIQARYNIHGSEEFCSVVMKLQALACSNLDGPTSVLQIAQLRSEVADWFRSVSSVLKERDLKEGQLKERHLKEGQLKERHHDHEADALSDRQGLKMFGFSGSLWDKRIAKANASSETTGRPTS